MSMFLCNVNIIHQTINRIQARCVGQHRIFFPLIHLMARLSVLCYQRFKYIVTIQLLQRTNISRYFLP